jgi:Holliday junction resolvase
MTMPTVRISKPVSEAKIQAEIIRVLQSRGWYVVKLIQTTKNGIPDLIIHKIGITAYLEVKRPGHKLAVLQQLRFDELKAVGIMAYMVTGVDDLKMFK